MTTGLTAYLGLGANLGEDPALTLTQAIERIAGLPGVVLEQCSSLYRSAPIAAHGPIFINAVIAVSTTLLPGVLLSALLGIEAQFGRQRPDLPAPDGWSAARPLDVDLLLYGDLQYQTQGLSVPHPRLHLRAFVLHPLLEVAPEISIPGRGLARDWLASCADQFIERLPESSFKQVDFFNTAPPAL